MFNSQCSILIGRIILAANSIESFFELVRQCDLILHPANEWQSEIHLGLRIAHWELPIGQILGLRRSSGYCQIIFAFFGKAVLNVRYSTPNARSTFPGFELLVT